MNAYHTPCGGPMWPWRKDGTCRTCGKQVLNNRQAASKRLPVG